MYIPSIYVLFAAEFLLLLLGVSITLAIYLYRHRAVPPSEADENEEPADAGGSSYIEHLEQELLRNEARNQQQEADSQPGQANGGTAPAEAGDDGHSRLLDARNRFLKVEKQAAEHSDNEQAFWEHIFKGMKDVLQAFKTVETHETRVVEESVEHKKETREKVFYIETQGKKIDGEVNKLKDIIYEQENTVNGLRKALSQSAELFPDDSDQLLAMRAQLDSLEQQLKDSGTCMDVLELENNRLQQEVHQMEDRLAQRGAGNTAGTELGHIETTSDIDLHEMKEVLEKQEEQISELHNTIESLELEAEQAQKLKSTINSFARTSQEMMGCITILEEENEHLKHQLEEPPESTEAEAADDAGGDTEELKKRIKSLQEEIIKKDVNYAKLQDEFSSMEKEYLAMYEAIHGDNS